MYLPFFFGGGEGGGKSTWAQFYIPVMKKYCQFTIGVGGEKKCLQILPSFLGETAAYTQLLVLPEFW